MVKKNVKRVAKPKVYKKNRRSLITRQVSSLKERQTCALIYATGQTGSTTTTTPGTVTYYINNLFDVTNDSTYKQPRYFDQMAALYNMYRVNAIGYKFDVAALTGSSWFAVGLVPHDYTLSTNSFKSLQEDPRFKIYTTSLNRGPLVIRGFRTIHSIEDIPKNQLHVDDSYSSMVNASVTYKPQLRLYWQSLDETQAYGHWIQGQLTFYTTFFQLKQPTAS